MATPIASCLVNIMLQNSFVTFVCKLFIGKLAKFVQFRDYNIINDRINRLLYKDQSEHANSQKVNYRIIYTRAFVFLDIHAYYMDRYT